MIRNQVARFLWLNVYILRTTPHQGGRVLTDALPWSVGSSFQLASRSKMIPWSCSKWSRPASRNLRPGSGRSGCCSCRIYTTMRLPHSGRSEHIYRIIRRRYRGLSYWTSYRHGTTASHLSTDNTLHHTRCQFSLFWYQVLSMPLRCGVMEGSWESHGHNTRQN